MSKKARSIEEDVEVFVKEELSSYGLRYYSKTEDINSEIARAMAEAPSKTGKEGKNYPDIKLLLKNRGKFLPVMIEVKGLEGKLAKLTASGDVDNLTKSGTNNYTNIGGFAVNGAVHYAQAIVDFTDSYKEVIAIGINGYDVADTRRVEYGVYFVAAENFCIAQKIAEYTDLSFLSDDNIDEFVESIERLKLTPAQIEAQSRKIEERIESSLKSLNQAMQDDLRISVGSRVELITGMIMAGLGVPNKVDPLEITDLKGRKTKNNNDGKIILDRIGDFLEARQLPDDKKQIILTDLSRVFINSGLASPGDGNESKLKTVFIRVKNEILPVFTSAHHLDFTGKLFNVLNEWVDIPDSDKNDVVLTPRYVTEMMAKLALVNQNSYVWDYAAGSAGFLISSMKIMLKDAEENIKSPAKYNKKVREIHSKQLLGIEKRSDIYMLAVLNMILMGDGSTNILHDDSLKFDGKYVYGDDVQGKPFPADVFLLNPPYSASGKGFIFVEKALSHMSKGRAVVLIQENAGSGSGLPYTQRILENNTLVASIKMADVFSGKASVRTAVYVFDVGKKHNIKSDVIFIDMSDDGYTRQNRKKSGLDINLRDTGDANGRYQEVVDVILYGESYLRYYVKGETYFTGKISRRGDDWTVRQHKKVDTQPTREDFERTVGDYLAWELGHLVKGGLLNENAVTSFKKSVAPGADRILTRKVRWERFRVGCLFEIRPTKAYKMTNVDLFRAAGDTPVLTNTSANNGISGYADLPPTEAGGIITFSDTTTTDSIFYQPCAFIGYSHVQGMYFSDTSVKLTKNTSLFIVAAFRKAAGGSYDYATKFNRGNASNIIIQLPVKRNGKPDFNYMEKYISAVEAKKMDAVHAHLHKRFSDN